MEILTSELYFWTHMMIKSDKTTFISDILLEVVVMSN